jgi:hypothetical protein
MRALHIDLIEGALVTFPFYSNGKYVKNGEWLDHDTLAKMPISNRNSLQDKGYPHPVPKAAVAAISQVRDALPDSQSERHVINRGFGRFDVIEGRVLTDKPVGKEAAYALAGQPLPDKEAQ